MKSKHYFSSFFRAFLTGFGPQNCFLNFQAKTEGRKKKEYRKGEGKKPHCAEEKEVKEKRREPLRHGD